MSICRNMDKAIDPQKLESIHICNDQSTSEGMKTCWLLSISIAATLFVPFAEAQRQLTQSALEQNSPVSEMNRLAKALVGDWNTTEIMERGELFPNGGERHGTIHVRLAAGGTTLIYEVDSDGSVGQLDGMLVIWWDKEATRYRLFGCFNDPSHPCKLRHRSLGRRCVRQ